MNCSKNRDWQIPRIYSQFWDRDLDHFFPWRSGSGFRSFRHYLLANWKVWWFQNKCSDSIHYSCFFCFDFQTVIDSVILIQTFVRFRASFVSKVNFPRNFTTMTQTANSSSLHRSGKKSSATSNAENPTGLPDGRSKKPNNDPNVNFNISSAGKILVHI